MRYTTTATILLVLQAARTSRRDISPTLSVQAMRSSTIFWSTALRETPAFITDSRANGQSLNFRLKSAGLFSGPNVDAPQNTYQSDKQIRYDGVLDQGLPSNSVRI